MQVSPEMRLGCIFPGDARARKQGLMITLSSSFAGNSQLDSYLKEYHNHADLLGY